MFDCSAGYLINFIPLLFVLETMVFAFLYDVILSGSVYSGHVEIKAFSLHWRKQKGTLTICMEST